MIMQEVSNILHKMNTPLDSQCASLWRAFHANTNLLPACYLSSTHLEQWYSAFFVRVPPDIISIQLCTPKVGV
jgi:hypothetical protein